MGSCCLSCGENDEGEPGHSDKCRWGVRAIKKDGYLYGVAGQRVAGSKPLLVAQEKTRGAAIRAARLQMKAEGPLYSLVEVRVVTSHAEVTDRFFRDEAGKWRHTDVRQRVIAAQDELVTPPLPPPPPDPVGLQFQLGQ